MLVALDLGTGIVFGATEVGVTATAKHLAAAAAAAPILALWGIGSLLGGVVATRIGGGAKSAPGLVALILALAVTHGALLLGAAVAGGLAQNAGPAAAFAFAGTAGIAATAVALHYAHHLAAPEHLIRTPHSRSVRWASVPSPRWLTRPRRSMSGVGDGKPSHAG